MLGFAFHVWFCPSASSHLENVDGFVFLWSVVWMWVIDHRVRVVGTIEYGLFVCCGEMLKMALE